MSQQGQASQQLQEAFDQFNELSEQLQGSYQQLQHQVILLTRELHAARSEASALQEQVDRRERLLTMGEMMAKLAHQVRTPLATALLYASHLSKPQLSAEQRSVSAQRIQAGLHHLDEIINDMLVFTRGGRSGGENISLQDLVKDVRQALMPQLQQAEADWQFIAETGDAVITGNKISLTGALTNLAVNALQNGIENIQLKWVLQVSDEAVCLSLHDNGPGIPESISDKIFEPFFTTRNNGTGLGLAVVRAVIEAHGGAVELDAQVNRGTCFVINLPLITDSKQLPSNLFDHHNDDCQMELRSV